MKLHKDALMHHAASEWARGTQHRPNQFSQLKIQGGQLNYACKRIVDSLMKRNTIQKRLSFWKRQDCFIMLDRECCDRFPSLKVSYLLIKVEQIPHEKMTMLEKVGQLQATFVR